MTTTHNTVEHFCLHCAVSVLVQGALHMGKDPVKALGEILQVAAEMIASVTTDPERDRMLAQALALLNRETQKAVFSFAQEGRYDREAPPSPEV